jgi:hypothetical protein
VRAGPLNNEVTGQVQEEARHPGPVRVPSGGSKQTDPPHCPAIYLPCPRAHAIVPQACAHPAFRPGNFTPTPAPVYPSNNEYHLRDIRMATEVLC